MAFFSRLSVRAKLLLAFTGLALITGIVGALGISKLSDVNDNVGTLYNRELKGTVHILQAARSLAVIGRDLRQLIIESDDKARQPLKEAVETGVKSCEESLAAADGFFVTAEGQAQCDKSQELYKQFVAKVNDTVSLALANKTDEAKVPLAESRAIAKQVGIIIDDLIARKEVQAKEAYESSGVTYSNARTMMLTFIGGGVIIGLALGYFISRWFARAILEVDEISNSVAAASQQLAAASEQLASGSQEAATSLEETAASLEEITVTVRQNAENADQANQLAASSRDTAEKGGSVVQDAVRAMGEINQASKRIADIITTIDEIAFQTNLLALNAAVEAARAGEQGRGFAVVAGEVRNLAQRSATAAKEIKRLIEDSVQKVEAGSRYVNQSGETLDGIVASVKRVTDIVAEIAAASREQSTGIEQVNRAITQLDQVTQGNSSQTEEMSGTAVTLSSQAEQLKSVVAQFNLSNDKQTKKFKTAKPLERAVTLVQRGSTVPASASKTRATNLTGSQPRSTTRDAQKFVAIGASEDADAFQEF
jgi:methyl-accepting chemotaxis protein